MIPQPTTPIGLANVRRHQSALASSTYRAHYKPSPSTNTQRKRPIHRPLKRGLSKDDMHLTESNNQDIPEGQPSKIEENPSKYSERNTIEEGNEVPAPLKGPSVSKDSRTTSVSASGSGFGSNESNPVVSVCTTSSQGDQVTPTQAAPSQTTEVRATVDRRHLRMRGRSRSFRYRKLQLLRDAIFLTDKQSCIRI